MSARRSEPAGAAFSTSDPQTRTAFSTELKAKKAPNRLFPEHILAATPHQDDDAGSATAAASTTDEDLSCGVRWPRGAHGRGRRVCCPSAGHACFSGGGDQLGRLEAFEAGSSDPKLCAGNNCNPQEPQTSERNGSE